MKDFTRVVWVSADARDYYEPKIKSAAAAWLQAELDSVRTGIRDAALVYGEPHGVESLLVSPNRYAVGPQRHELAEAIDQRDDDRVGQLLGFPACCREFFARTWGAGALDTTFEMANGNAHGPIECNILGRWLGLRWVTHLPCSFRCAASQEIGLKFRTLLSKEHAATVDDVLSWQTEWSALHGIAEVRFPVLKVITRTTYTASERVVRRQGTVPSGSPRGLRFPFSSSAQPLALTHFAYRDNGFSSEAVQAEMHQMVLDALAQSPPVGLAIDLGAGVGTLLTKIKQQFAVPTAGLELVARKAKQHPDIKVGSVELFPQHWQEVDTVIVSARRLEENPLLKLVAKEHARQVLVYSYDEPTFATFL